MASMGRSAVTSLPVSLRQALALFLVLALHAECAELGRWEPKSAKADSRIVDGQPAARHQFPYQAGVYINFSGFCGGSLISDRWVLTAGHCAYKSRTWAIFLGAHEMSQPKEEGRLVFVSSTGIVHEDYDPKTLKNDVAVVQLNRRVTFVENKIQPVRLPRRSQLNDLLAGSPATISGWGLVRKNANGISPVLRFVNLTIITNEQCIKDYDSEPIFDTTLCCQGEGIKSTCNGDSGGPLVITESDGRPTQVGVVSFGSDNGCDIGKPHGYSRVTAYMPWISDKTGIPIQD